VGELKAGGLLVFRYAHMHFTKMLTPVYMPRKYIVLIGNCIHIRIGYAQSPISSVSSSVLTGRKAVYAKCVEGS
jgi:hypothetical protein